MGRLSGFTYREIVRRKQFLLMLLRLGVEVHARDETKERLDTLEALIEECMERLGLSERA